jgi:nicotinamidase/pyrazinamidase
MDYNDVQYADSIIPKDNDALIVVDVQNDFMPYGSMPVSDGDKIVKSISKIMRMFFKSDLLVVLTQDWHPPGHKSFASAYMDKKPFEPYQSAGIGPVLWPDHCIQGTKGADFHEDLNISFSHAVIRKGHSMFLDSYSAFLENDKKTETGLDGFLKNKGIKRIFICGLSMDRSAFFTALDGIDKDYRVVFITQLTRPAGSSEKSITYALKTMADKGVKFIKTLE